MCPPFIAPLLGGLMTLGSSLLGPKPAKPPEPAAPAITDTGQKEEAVVRIGSQAEQDSTRVPGTGLQQQTDTRIFGRPVGGLGRSGLSI